MKQQLLNPRFLLLGLACVAAGWFVAQYVISNRTEVFTASLHRSLSDQHAIVLNKIESMRGDTVSDTVSSLVADCNIEQRQRFDTLLDRLESPMTQAELSELHKLFNECAYFFSDRRRLLSLELSGAVHTLEVLSGVAAKYSLTPISESNLSLYNEIANNERQLASLFNQLVKYQGAIIAELLSGNTPQAPALVAIREAVRVTRSEMNTTTVQIETARRQIE